GARPHPLFAALKGLVDGGPSVGQAAAAPDAGAPRVVDVSQLKPVATQPQQPSPPSGGQGGTPSGDDSSKSLLSQANKELSRGNLARAGQLYGAALDKNPNDSEAQAGLGDVAHAQHDLASAKRSYQKAIQINSHYLPALIGLADVEF